MGCATHEERAPAPVTHEGYYLRWLDLPLFSTELTPCRVMTQKVRQFVECNHVLIYNCVNFIKFDNVQMASSAVDLLGNGFIF